MSRSFETPSPSKSFAFTRTLSARSNIPDPTSSCRASSLASADRARAKVRASVVRQAAEKATPVHHCPPRRLLLDLARNASPSLGRVASGTCPVLAKA